MKEICWKYSKEINQLRKKKKITYKQIMRSTQWNKIKKCYKEYLIKKDGYKDMFVCRDCGNLTLFKNLRLHHTKYSHNHIFKFEHLQPICVWCHNKIHIKKIKNF